MAGPVADVAERGVKSFMNTMKEVGTEKAVSEALMGGAAGVGLNMAYNVASGDSGGYMGAGLLGGAAGGLGRTGLKHFNLETQASNLMSTFKTGAVGGMTKAQKAVGSRSDTKPTAQRIMHGKNEAPIHDYRRAEEVALKEGNRLIDTGYISQGQEQINLSQSYGLQRKNLESSQFKHQTKNMSPAEIEDRYASQGGAKYVQENLDPNFRSVADRVRDNTEAVKSMQANANSSKPKRTSNSNPATTGSASTGRGADDEHYSAALDYMVNKGKASSSGLQREFNIGHNRASSMMNAFEADGVVSPASKNGKRNLLI